MCTPGCLDFVARFVGFDEVHGKDVLEVGSFDTSGTVRPGVVVHGPRSYLGVDLEAGPGVDAICDVADLERTFGRASFDVVISTEMVEHVRDWRRAFANMKAVLRPGGLLVVTTRSEGFPFHFGPFDYWRYEAEDMERIAADMEIVKIEPDPSSPGVFLAARSQAAGVDLDLGSIALYSIVRRRRVPDISDAQLRLFEWTYPMAIARRLLPRPIRRRLKKLLLP